MSILCISDIHLSEARPSVTELFFKFLTREAEGVDELYILGDLFDSWIGDDENSQLAEDVKRNLARLSDTGTKLFLQHGNRDFLIGEKFLSRIKATLLDDYHLIEYKDHRLLLTHGDLLCTDDVDYQNFRKKVRKPLCQWFILGLPLFIRKRLANYWRKQSSKANVKKPSDIMEVNLGAVASVMDCNAATLLVHGHTHRPGRHGVDATEKERIVLGEWNAHGWAVSVSNDSAVLFKVKF
ncbi:MAG: UDP-2,3-diacylglucosamine diphosphatase [Porticoccaceae bacterium]|nr:UDP-2,3-diacylglucosamine diphosphatase [Porticoccaceae bacterium]